MIIRDWPVRTALTVGAALAVSGALAVFTALAVGAALTVSAVVAVFTALAL